MDSEDEDTTDSEPSEEEVRVVKLKMMREEGFVPLIDVVHYGMEEEVCILFCFVYPFLQHNDLIMLVIVFIGDMHCCVSAVLFVDCCLFLFMVLYLLLLHLFVIVICCIICFLLLFVTCMLPVACCCMLLITLSH
jgi:hypothetical protein